MFHKIEFFIGNYFLVALLCFGAVKQKLSENDDEDDDDWNLQTNENVAWYYQLVFVVVILWTTLACKYHIVIAVYYLIKLEKNVWNVGLFCKMHIGMHIISKSGIHHESKVMVFLRFNQWELTFWLDWLIRSKDSDISKIKSEQRWQLIGT